MKDNRLGRHLKAARLKQKYTLRDVERLSNGFILNSSLCLLERGTLKQKMGPHWLRAVSRTLKIDYLKLMMLSGYITKQDLQKRA